MKKSEIEKQADSSAARSSSAAFLLAQLGAHAAQRFARRLAPLRLAPAHSGILNLLGMAPGLTQQALAGRLRMLPSRLVSFLDDLESRGMIERRKNPDDRRSYALHLTEKGHSTLESVGRISKEHQKALLAALDQEDQQHLAQLLQRVADQQGLERGVHPGYARLRGPAGMRRR